MTNDIDRYPKLTDEVIEDARELIGVSLRTRPRISAASKDTILMFARAIGSRNPLYQDESYADGSFWGCLVAHPTLLYAVDDTNVAPRMAGLQGLYCGTRWEFLLPVRVGDQLSATRRLVDVEEKHGEFCGRMALQTGEIDYHNQNGQLVARATSSVMRVPRDEARRRGRYLTIERPPYDDELLRNIEDSYDQEEPRGSTPRYIEDVELGDDVDAIVRGPLTSEDMLHFVKTVVDVPALDNWADYVSRHPSAAYWDPEFGMPDTWRASLLKAAVAREFGFPSAHDTGFQRVTWLENMVTNWAGNLSFLQALDVRVTRPNLYDDTTWCRGRVSAVQRDDGRSHIAELEIRCENQVGEVTARGTASVALPSRDPSSLPPGPLIGLAP